MTQGQMGYMPQAQFLTSSDYGAYRTMPGMSTETRQDQQSNSMWQAYLQSRRGNVLGMTGDYFLNTYNPLRSQTNQTVMAQRRLSDMQASLGGAIGDLGLSTALPYMGLALGGPLGFMAGTGLSMLMPNIGEELASRRRHTREIQNMSMPSIVSGPDMASTLGRGFSTTAADKLRRSMDRAAIDDTVFNKEDYASFMKSGIENNLMDYSSDATQYMSTIKKLSGNIKFLKEAFENKDMQTLFSDMRRLQTMGASLPDMQAIGHSEAMFSRIAGISHEQMVSSYGQPGALQFTQKGLTGYQGSLTSMGHAANITLAQRSGLISAEELSRVGGKSGLTQTFTEGSASWQKGIQKSFVPGLMDQKGEVDFKKLSAYMAGDISITQMGEASASALQRDGGKNVAAIMQQSPEALSSMQKRLGSEGMNALMAKYYMDVGTEALGKKASAQDRMFIGAVADLGEEGAHAFAKQYSSPEMQKDMIRQLEVQQRKLADAAKQEYKDANSFKNRIFKGFRRMGYGVFGSTWDQMSRTESENSEENEQRRLGIYSTIDRGMAQSLGLNTLESESYYEVEPVKSGTSKADLYKTIRRFKEGEESALEKELSGTLRDTSTKGTSDVVNNILEDAISGDLSKESLLSVVQDNAKELFSDDFIKANTREDGTLSGSAVKDALFKENDGALGKLLLQRTHSAVGTSDERKIDAWTQQYDKDQTGRADLYKTIRRFKEGEESALEKELSGTLRDTSTKGTSDVVNNILEDAISGDLSKESLLSVVQDNAKELFSDDFITANTREDGTLSESAVKDVLFKENDGALGKLLLQRTHSAVGTSDERKIDAWTRESIKAEKAEESNVPQALADKDTAFLQDFEEGIFAEDSQELRAQVAFRNRALHSEMSEDDIVAARKELGVTGLEMVKGLRGMDAKHFTKDEFASRYAQMKNIKIEEADKILSANGGRGYQYMGFKALTGSDGIKTRIGLEDLQEKDTADIAEHLKEYTQKSYDKAFKARKAFAGNERNAEELGDLSAGIDDHAGREGANFLIASHAILNRQEAAKGWGGEDTSEEDREYFIKLWEANSDLSRDDIEDLFDNMRRDKVDAYGRSINADEDELKKIHARAKDKHLTRKTGKEIVELSNTASDTTRQALLAGTTTNMTYAITKELGVSGHKGPTPEVSELLKNPEQAKELYAGVKDKGSAGGKILKQITDLHSSGKEMNIAQFAGKIANSGIVETGVEVSAKQMSTVVGSQDTRYALETLETQKSSIEALRSSAEKIEKNTTAIKRAEDASNKLTEATIKATESKSAFSLFNLGS
jgi:hypothetical protein